MDEKEEGKKGMNFRGTVQNLKMIWMRIFKIKMMNKIFTCNNVESRKPET